MDIIEFLNRLASERLHRELCQRCGAPITYSCGDIEILATAIEVLS